MRRTLIHYWRMNLAVVAGAAVACAVLTGALLVGDSVRGSLRDLTLERLGAVDHALAGQRFFRYELAGELAATPGFGERFERAAPAILLQGGARHAESRARASDVGIRGVDDAFLAFVDDPGGELAALLDGRDRRSIFPPAVINESLREALGAEVGDDLLISLERWSEVPRGSLLGRKDTGSVVETVRFEVAGVVPDRGAGRFALSTHQASPYNLFVPLAALQKSLGQEGTVNALLVTERGEAGGAESAAELDQLLAEAATAADLGIAVSEGDGFASVESREFILDPAVAKEVEAIAGDRGAPVLRVLTYLVNRLRHGDASVRDASVPYSTVTAMDVPPPPEFGELPRVDGGTVTALGEGEILLNSWTAGELAAEVGDEVELTYFVVGPREELREESTTLRVAGVVAMESLAADPTLAQEYPGIADADDMSEWDPPFPIELSRVRSVDEAYWDDYRGTPKAFVALAAGRELWRNRWGELTAIRVAPAPGGENGAGGVAELAEDLRRELVSRIPLDAFDLAFRPVKALGLGASGGATDFGGLFLGMSFFLIISAAMLVALLFGLGVERRAAEVGLLRAVGYPEARVRRRLLAEGGLLAAGGSLLGLGGAVGYAALLMAGLRSWWRPAVGTSELYLHLVPTSLAIGYLASVAVVLAAVWWRVRKLRRVPTPALLARVAEPPDTRPGRVARITAGVALGLAATLVLFAFATGETENPAVFFAAGPAFLVGFLALFSLRLGGLGGGLGEPGRSRGALFRLALGNSGRNRGRSLLSTTLVASASFLIVTVAAYQSDFTRAELGRDSGTGGFELVAESDVPLLHRLDDPDGRFELGVAGDAEEILAASEVASMPLLPGDDTSCLNLYQPQQPRLLGVPPELVERGGFTFQKSVEEVENPWTLLHQDLGPGVIPVIGDFNSTQWILKLPVGEELVMEDGRGEEIRLRLVAALATSIFQSELLISEEHFRRHFPDRDGWSYFLVSPGSAEGGTATEEVARSLEGALEDYGFDAVPAAEKLESFHAVQNTYLSTFRTLGGLGLLLGTVGLAIVLLRNVIERRGELAALRAFGYRRTTLTRMVVVENAFLLLAGLVIGAVAALVTAAPHLLSAAAAVPWGTMAGTLAAIFLFGLLACTLAAAGAGRIPLLPALRAEG